MSEKTYTLEEIERAELLITFPTAEHRDDFLAWLCDGGGEYMYMEVQSIERDSGGKLTEIVKFDYSDAFTAWGHDGSEPLQVHCYARRAGEEVG